MGFSPDLSLGILVFRAALRQVVLFDFCAPDAQTSAPSTGPPTEPPPSRLSRMAEQAATLNLVVQALLEAEVEVFPDVAFRHRCLCSPRRIGVAPHPPLAPRQQLRQHCACCSRPVTKAQNALDTWVRFRRKQGRGGPEVRRSAVDTRVPCAIGKDAYSARPCLPALIDCGHLSQCMTLATNV